MDQKENSVNKRGKSMNKLSFVLFILGIASLVYFFVCLAYAGLSTSFTVVWGIVGIVSILSGIILRKLWLHGYQWPTWIKLMSVVILTIGLIVFISAESVIVYYSNQKAPDKVEYVIVLGARVNGTRITGSLWRRLDKTVEYLSKDSNKEVQVIVSGGQGPGEDISEAQAMHDYLIRNGIEQSRIIMEDKSTNTYENIKFSREIINNDDAEVAIVTNGFHVYRATSIAKKQGMTKVHGLSATSDPVMTFSYYVREGFAVVAYKLKGSI